MPVTWTILKFSVNAIKIKSRVGKKREADQKEVKLLKELEKRID